MFEVKDPQTLHEFAVFILESVGLVNNSTPPMNVAENFAIRNDDLKGRDNGIEFEFVLYDVTLEGSSCEWK